MDTMNLKHAYDDYVNYDMPFHVFENLCRKSWSTQNHGFITINREKSKNQGKYAMGLHNSINIQ